jgi:hypothetical protein
MMDAIMMVTVLGVVLLVLGVDVGALVAWLRRRWR